MADRYHARVSTRPLLALLALLAVLLTGPVAAQTVRGHVVDSTASPLAA